MHAASFSVDPKHLGFVLARYHFVARMFTGFEKVLEIGCGDCTGASIVEAVVSRWWGLDKVKATRRNVMQGNVLGKVFWPSDWDGIYALDVLEHIDQLDEEQFFLNINASLADHGVVIIGSPSLESQKFASVESRKHHVNCKNEDQLRKTLQWFYHNVFLFGMNDTTLHTGFGPFCHYRLAICTGKKDA